MSEESLQLAVLVVVVGAVAVLALVLKAGCARVRVPPLIGYLIIGLVLRGVDARVGLIPETGEVVFDFLGKLGIIALLFGVGLRSELRELLARLKPASSIWLGNIVISGGVGLAAAYWLLDFDLIPSIIVGTAMTATSVGVPSAVWSKMEALRTNTGELFVDVAELDDISGVLLMALLFAVLPALKAELHETQPGGPAAMPVRTVAGDAGRAEALAAGGPMPSGDAQGRTQRIVPVGDARARVRTVGAAASGAHTADGPGFPQRLLWGIGRVLMKLGVFVALCYVFARYAGGRLVRLAERIEPAPDSIITITAVGIIIAGLAGILGFSVAIGAFFAGLALSRQRGEVMVQSPYCTLHNLFVPFFFVGIGLHAQPYSLGPALWPALVLLAAAVAGKLLGTLGPALAATGLAGAAVLGVSMVPRAEITMIIMSRGLQLGDWAVTRELFSAMVLVSAATCLAAPPVLRVLIQKTERTPRDENSSDAGGEHA